MDKCGMFLIIFLLSNLIIAEAIVCFDCNSEHDNRCGDPFKPFSIGRVNCSLRQPLDHLQGMKPTICRKIVQKVYGQIRVIRGCGYIPSEHDNKECVYRTGAHNVYVHYCSCSTHDECNGSNEFYEGPKWTYLLFLVVLIAYF